jgi:hypothetical protein
MILEHRAAISLNNTGVALLQRRCYQQGFRTLRDAAGAMSAAASRRVQEQHGCTGDGNSSSRETFCVEAMLRQAEKRLSKPEPSVDRNAARQYYDLQVLSECEHPAVLLDCPHHKSVSTPSPSLHHHNTITPVAPSTPLTGPRADFNDKRAYLLRIETLNYDASVEHNYNVQSSIILQNFGIAFLCMSNITDAASTNPNVQLTSTAMQIFKKSYSILMLSCQSHLSGNSEEMELQRFYLLASLILLKLVELSTLLGLHLYLLDYNSRLENIRNSARDMQDWSQKGFAAGAA